MAYAIPGVLMKTKAIYLAPDDKIILLKHIKDNIVYVETIDYELRSVGSLKDVLNALPDLGGVLLGEL